MPLIILLLKISVHFRLKFRYAIWKSDLKAELENVFQILYVSEHNIYYLPYRELCLPLPMSEETRQVMHLFWCELCTELLSWVNEPLIGYRLLHLNFVTGILPKCHKSSLWMLL